ncbi:hypothetical protein F5X96DRAFT_665477 [Biscogniauxia mediterranea]|nr:hypothetical protein F5X96DRAFT_665477 [Biscogniauxia mediterranea]
MWFMNRRQPQPDPGCPLPTESHWQRFLYTIDPQQFLGYNVPVSQLFVPQFMPQIMMEGQYYAGGDESSDIDDFYNLAFQDVGMGTPNTTAQTAAANVSSVAFGRDSVPSHPQTNDKGLAGNEQMGFPGRYHTANAHKPSFEETFGHRSAPWQYNPAAIRQREDYVDFQDGLPHSALYPPMPIFGETSEYGLGTPGMTNDGFSSSMGSSIASDRMALMTLESAPAQGNVSTINPESDWRDTWPATISPKMLRISPSPTPKSSCESMRNDLVASGGSDIVPSSVDQRHAHDAYSSSSKHSSHKHRKELPDKPRKSRATPSVSYRPISSAVKPAQMANSRSMPRHDIMPRYDIMPQAQGPAPRSPQIPREPQAPQGLVAPVDTRLSAKDEFLVTKKLEGMTYREIRTQGNFSEAESTLRGRFRTLTKRREDRVRKPEWQDNDIRLLKKAVHKLARGDDPASAKVPWKQVADYITEHGGSYHFGNATCRKKWDELVSHGKAGLK